MAVLAELWHTKFLQSVVIGVLVGYFCPEQRHGVAVDADAGLFVDFQIGLIGPGNRTGLGNFCETSCRIFGRTMRVACTRQAIAFLQRDPGKIASAHGVSNQSVGGPDGAQWFFADLNHAPKAGFETDIKAIPQSLRVAQARIRRQDRIHEVRWGKDFNGKSIGLNFLTLILSDFTRFVHVLRSASEPACVRRQVPFHQEMAKFMGDGETCAPLAARGVGKNGTTAADLVCQEHTFEAIEGLGADLQDAKFSGNVLYRDRGCDLTKLNMQSGGNRLRRSQVAEIDSGQSHWSAGPRGALL